MAQTYCTQCGKLVQTTANFCGFCGVALHGQEAAQAYYTSRAQVQPTQQSALIPQAELTEPQGQPNQPEAQAEPIREHVDPMSQVSMMLSYITKTGVILLFAIILAFFEFWLGMGLTVMYLLILMISAHLTWSNFYYMVDNTCFQKQHGILHKQNVTIPLNRIQNVNVSRTLMDRMLGLARVDIETAGSSMTEKQQVVGGSYSKAEGHLPGLSIAKARQLHDTLLDRAANSQQGF